MMYQSQQTTDSEVHTNLATLTEGEGLDWFNSQQDIMGKSKNAASYPMLNDLFKPPIHLVDQKI